MSSRSTPPPQKGSFFPAADASTYRDLLLFEERLKTNAASLYRRKARYQLFLVQLLAIIVFLLSEVLLQTSLLSLPYKFILIKALRHQHTREVDLRPHPYFATVLLTIAITTLVLFFASGLYAEKIGYANRYVPHANRALRSFNVYLNVRHQPLRSRILKPLSWFFPRDTPHDSPSLTTPPTSPDREPRRSIPPLKRNGTMPVPIAPIPPSTNPRGELIFSSRVDRAFREGYERYRAAFERRREERERWAAGKTWRGMVWPGNWRWWGRAMPMPPAPFLRGHSPGGSVTGGRGRLTGSASGSTGSTPTGSRRSSPAPGLGSVRKGRAGAGGGGGSLSRSGTPVGLPSRLSADRTRTESFSFLLSGDQNVA
ncbi:hypothetical protein BD410DRAFT_363681 [Rickenella mellea]|uniref:Transmembrane protein 188 n=1 Tax=Rickenella mellea TaxID=50990 RepID=A0A4Y7PZ79_9AGAM|nr:hypothetical protein BD410DRAFT_363681 [Rickenella mellea]